MPSSTLQRLVPLAAVTLLAGCSLASLHSAPMAGEASLRIQPRIQAGGYAAQATISPYSSDDVNHLVLTLHTVVGSTETQVATADVPKLDLGRTIVFGKLRPDLTYRIKARAYKATGTAPADLISVDASSSALVVVGRKDEHAVGLSVQLADRPFSATTVIPGVTVTDSQFVASGSVTVTASPAPTPAPSASPTPYQDPCEDPGFAEMHPELCGFF